MAVLDSFIKGYQDSQSRNDTLKAKAESLKQLQEEKLRQARMDSEQRAKFGLQYLDQQLKDPEWWKANRKNTQVIGSVLSQKNTFEDALGLPRTSGLSDMLPQLFAQRFAELQQKVSSGDMTPDAADRAMEAEVGADVIEEQMFKVQNSAILEGKKPEEVFQAQLKPVVPAKLRASKPPVKPELKLAPTGDQGIDDTVKTFTELGDIAKIKSYLQELPKGDVAVDDALFGNTRTDQETKDLTSGTVLENAMGSHPAYKLLQEVEAYENMQVQFEADKKQYDADLEADRLEKERVLQETELNNSILRDTLKGSTNIAGRKGLRFMFAQNWDKQATDKKRAEFDKRVNDYGPSTPDGVKERDWAYATEQGWTTKLFAEWASNPMERSTIAKGVDADVKSMRSDYNTADKALRLEAAKYPPTPEGRAEFMSVYGDAILKNKMRLASINKADGFDAEAGYVPYTTGGTDLGYVAAEQRKTNAQNQVKQFDMTFDERRVQNAIDNEYQRIGLKQRDRALDIEELRLQHSMTKGQDGKDISWTNVEPRGPLNAVASIQGSDKVKGPMKGLNPAFKYGLVIDPNSNGVPRSAAIYAKYKQFSQFLMSKNILGETNGEMYLSDERMKSAMDTDKTLQPAIDGYINEINALTKSYQEKYPWFASTTYTDRGGVAPVTAQLPTSPTPAPAGMPELVSDGKGGMRVKQPVGGITKKSTGGNKTAVKPKTGGGSKPSDFTTPIGTTKARNKNGKIVPIEIYN